MNHLPKADKEQCGAFIVGLPVLLLNYNLNSKKNLFQRDERVLIVWSDDLDHIVPLCSEFDEKLMKLVWRSRLVASPSVATSDSTPIPSTTASNVNLNEKAASARASVTVTEAAVATAAVVPPKKFWGFGWKLSSKKPHSGAVDLEKGPTRSARPIRLLAPLYGGLGSALSLCAYALNIQACTSNIFHPFTSS